MINKTKYYSFLELVKILAGQNRVNSEVDTRPNSLQFTQGAKYKYVFDTKKKNEKHTLRIWNVFLPLLRWRNVWPGWEEEGKEKKQLHKQQQWHQVFMLDKETTLERAAFQAGWSELLWSGRAQPALA